MIYTIEFKINWLCMIMKSYNGNQKKNNYYKKLNNLKRIQKIKHNKYKDSYQNKQNKKSNKFSNKVLAEFL